MNKPISSTLVETVMDKLPPMPKRFFIVAYWRRNDFWKVFETLYESPTCDEIVLACTKLQMAGWSHLEIHRLARIGREDP